MKPPDKFVNIVRSKTLFLCNLIRHCVCDKASRTRQYDIVIHELDRFL